MFKTIHDWLAAQLHQILADRRRRPAKPRPTFKPVLRRLEDRIVPSTDFWQPNVVNGPQETVYNIDTNWSENHAPLAGEDVVFDSAHNRGNAPCNIASGLNLPAFNSITFGDQLAAINIGSNLAAATISILPRTGVPAGGATDVNLVSGATLDATSTLSWTGGGVTGSGTLQVTGTGTINGTSATDMPTLGTNFNVGDGTIATTLTTSANSQPLVVKGNAAITINANAEMDLDNNPLHIGSASVAVSNGDGGKHSITVAAEGKLVRTNSSECVVGMGLQVQGGELDVNTTGGGGDVGPLHFTGFNSDGMSLIVCCGGQVYARGSLTADGGGEFYDSGTQVYAYKNLTLGINANSIVSHLDGGVISLFGGTLVAHGGFTINGGALQTGGVKAKVQMDAGNVFTLNDGEIDVTYTGAVPVATGELDIMGAFTATGGNIVNDVDTRDGLFAHGTFKVFGNISLSTALLLSSLDLNPAPGVVNHDWDLFDWTGSRTGMLTWSLPAGWTGNPPDDVHKDLIAHEP